MILKINKFGVGEKREGPEKILKLNKQRRSWNKSRGDWKKFEKLISGERGRQLFKTQKYCCVISIDIRDI